MSDERTVTTILTAHGMSLNAAPVSDPTRPSHYYAFVALDFDSNGHQIPSRRTLTSAIEALHGLNLAVEILLVDTRTRGIESAARASLLHIFPEFVRNVFITTTASKADVWIDAKRSLDEPKRAEITARLNVLLGAFDLQLGALATLGEGNVPNKLATLRAIRQLAPVLPDALSAELSRQGFEVPSADWLRRKLDTFRRSGDVVRLQDDAYVLSASAVRSLGTSQRGRSPDVSRLLALARGAR